MDLSFLERKERIILTTIDVMNEFGIHSVSTKVIAKREGITEAAIFKYFPHKNDLYLAVLDYFSMYDSDIFDSITMKNLSPCESILAYEEMYCSYYENYPSITVISHSFDEMMYNKDLKEKILEIINTRKDFLKNYIKKAQEIGEISSSADTDILIEIFIGTINALSFNWRMSDYTYSYKEKSKIAIEMLLKAFQ